jgi:hypothetical protein
MAKGWTAQIAAADLAFLEKRGAISQRGPGATFSRSAVLHRELQLLRELLRRYDPRKSAALPDAMYQLAARLLPAPWSLKPFEIDQMATLLETAPGFAAAAQEAAIDPAAFLAAIAALGFVEKVALLDHALEVQAPAAAAVSRDGP